MLWQLFWNIYVPQVTNLAVQLLCDLAEAMAGSTFQWTCLKVVAIILKNICATSYQFSSPAFIGSGRSHGWFYISMDMLKLWQLFWNIYLPLGGVSLGRVLFTAFKCLSVHNFIIDSRQVKGHHNRHYEGDILFVVSYKPQILPELGTNLHKYCSHIHSFFSSLPFISYCARVHVEHIN